MGMMGQPTAGAIGSHWLSLLRKTCLCSSQHCSLQCLWERRPKSLWYYSKQTFSFFCLNIYYFSSIFFSGLLFEIDRCGASELLSQEWNTELQYCLYPCSPLPTSCGGSGIIIILFHIFSIMHKYSYRVNVILVHSAYYRAVLYLGICVLMMIFIAWGPPCLPGCR